MLYFREKIVAKKVCNDSVISGSNGVISENREAGSDLIRNVFTYLQSK
ncbi:hypothetical protein [Flavobacterium laiguense]|nr:hypothetical protein [Flavobacterium laiguense]